MHDLEFTGERVVPGKVEDDLFLEHVSRYRFAARFAAGREVLDFGCGAGYGAAILRRAGARLVIGSDLAPAAVRYARDRYGGPGIGFCAADCEAACFPDARFDLVVSFELIEHLRSYRAFLAEVRRILRPGGLFLVSTPNKGTYRTEPGTPPNPYHVHEFEIAEFDRELRGHFAGVTVLGQSRTEGVLFHRAARAQGEPGRRALLAADAPGAADLLSTSAYLLALCSDDPAAVEVAGADHFEVADTNAVRSRDLRILELQAELEERTRWAKSLEEESSRRGQRVLELQDLVEERTRWAQGLERESEGREQRVAELEGEIERLGASLPATGPDDRVGRRLAEVERSLERQLAELRGELARRGERERERDEIERWHRDSLIRQQQEIERHRQALAEAARRSAENERGIEQQRRLVDRLGLALRALSRRADHHQAELAAWIAQAREIEISADRARELVDLLWGSRSWRLYAGAKRAVEAALPWRPARRLENRPAARAGEAAKDGGAGPPRALVVDHRLPTPDRDAGSVRMVEVIRQLQALGFEVVFVPENLYAMEPYCEQLRRLGVEVVVAPRVTSLTQYLAAEGAGFQLALVSRLHIASGCFDSVRELCRNAKLVFDTVDLQHLRLERQARLAGDPSLAAEAERTKAEELGMAARADATLVVSDAERDLLRREIPGLAVHRVSLIERVRTEVPDFDDREGFYFVGGFEHPPNVDAVLWFGAEVLPAIRRELPRATFHVLGSKTPEAVHALEGEGVVVSGHVPEMERYLLGCRLSIAPLRYGAGIKGKVTQSLAWGLPCVMTAIAAEGIGLTHGTDALIAEEPGDFARCVIDAYRDRELWQRLSTAGRQRIHERFSPEVARAALGALLDELGVEHKEAARG